MRYEAAIYRYAAYMCGRDAADDIVQETFLAILQQMGRHDPPEGAVISYLIGIARHRILKRADRGNLREAEDISDALEAWPDTRQPTPLDDVARAESIEHVRAAVESLPPVFREAIVLCELQEMGYAEAASVIGCPIGTVRSRLHRAKSLLGTKLRQLSYGS